MFFTFLRFFENPKKRDFLRFCALLHTFSRTMATGRFHYVRISSHLCEDIRGTVKQLCGTVKQLFTFYVKDCVYKLRH